MKRAHLDALKTLGIKKESYCRPHLVEGDPWPPIWGISLTDSRGTTYYVEHVPRDCDGDGKYHLRTQQYNPLSDVGTFSRQQDAVAEVIRRWFR